MFLFLNVKNITLDRFSALSLNFRNNYFIDLQQPWLEKGKAKINFNNAYIIIGDGLSRFSRFAL